MAWEVADTIDLVLDTNCGFFWFTGPIQPITGGRGFSWPDCQLLVDAALWSTEYIVVCFVPQQYPLSWKCTNLYDDICVGSSQRRRQDGVSRFLNLPCSIFTMGHVDVQCDAGTLDYDGFDWHCCGTHVLLFWVCVSSHGRNSRLEGTPNNGTAGRVALALRQLRKQCTLSSSSPCPGRRSPAPRLNGAADAIVQLGWKRKPISLSSPAFLLLFNTELTFQMTRHDTNCILYLLST